MAPGDPKLERWTKFVREYETDNPDETHVVMGAGPINYRSGGVWKHVDDFPGWGYNNPTKTYSTDSDDLRITARNNVITITDELGTTTLTLTSVDLDDSQWVSIPPNTGPTPTGATKLTWSYLQGKILVHLDAASQSMSLSFEITENVLSGQQVTGDAIYLRIGKSGVEREWSGITAVRGSRGRETPVLWDVQPGYIRKGVATSWLTQPYFFPIIIDPTLQSIGDSYWLFRTAYNSAAPPWTYGYSLNQSVAQWIGSQSYQIGKDPWTYEEGRYVWVFDLSLYPGGTFSNESASWYGYQSTGTFDWTWEAIPNQASYADLSIPFNATADATLGTGTNAGSAGTPEQETVSGTALHDRMVAKSGSQLTFRLRKTTIDYGSLGYFFPPRNSTYYPTLSFNWKSSGGASNQYEEFEFPMPEWDPEGIMFSQTEPPAATSQFVVVIGGI